MASYSCRTVWDLQLIGLKAKIYAKERFKEKVQMKKTIAQHSERDNKHKTDKGPEGAMPAYLLDREEVRCASQEKGREASSIRPQHAQPGGAE